MFTLGIFCSNLTRHRIQIRLTAESRSVSESAYNQCGSETLMWCMQCCGCGSDIRDPGSGAFLPPGSGIQIWDEFFPDLGSQGFVFWWDFLKNPCSFCFTNKTCSWNYKKQEKCFSSLFLCTVGSGIRDPGSSAFSDPRIRDPDLG
jgi:hypothetical protein